MSYYIVNDEKPDTGPDFNLEADDPTLNSKKAPFNAKSFYLSGDLFQRLFFDGCQIAYVCDHFRQPRDFRVVSHPELTHTCYQKAEILDNWDPLNVIKALYLDNPVDGYLYVCVIPETGCFVDKKYVAQLLGLPGDTMLAKAKQLPKFMTFGTCSPFITQDDLVENGGRVKKIIFDSETLITKKHDNRLDDFSFGMDHRFSIHMNYYQCYKMLKRFFGDTVDDKKILQLSFKEKLLRKNGRIKIEYDFKTLNYRTASFINSIHGFGDVTIINDHVDELDLPEVLISSNGT